MPEVSEVMLLPSTGGRPAYDFNKEELIGLLDMGFTGLEIAKLYGVGKTVVYDRIKQYEIGKKSITDIELLQRYEFSLCFVSRSC
jgi:hypothetical protein